MTNGAAYAEQDTPATLAQLETRLSRLERKQRPNDYQGWSNYETWVVSLWMDNDAKQYLRMRSFAEKQLVQCGGDKDDAVVTFAGALKEETENGVPYSVKGVYHDLLHGALSQVNFFEIARSWMEDIELPPTPPVTPSPEKAPLSSNSDKQPSGKYTIAASSAVLAVLSQATIDEEGLTLPGDQLERRLYEEVDSFLKIAGAKWHKGQKRHLFKNAKAREKIMGLLESGRIVNEKKLYQAFYTPTAVAQELAGFAGIESGMPCLEPSAGAGAIALAARNAGGGVLCVEANPDACSELAQNGFTLKQTDFLTLKPEELGLFDRVLMNPPFTDDQDIKHVTHAFSFLKPGGKLYAIMSPGFTYSEQSKARTDFRKLVAEHGRIIKELPEGTFQESGTGVRTVIVELAQPEAGVASDLFGWELRSNEYPEVREDGPPSTPT